MVWTSEGEKVEDRVQRGSFVSCAEHTRIALICVIMVSFEWWEEGEDQQRGRRAESRGWLERRTRVPWTTTAESAAPPSALR